MNNFMPDALESILITKSNTWDRTISNAVHNVVGFSIQFIPSYRPTRTHVSIVIILTHTHIFQKLYPKDQDLK